MVDLHMHSNYSDDGAFTPLELVEKCAVQGIEVMAVTDHNCASANGEVIEAARERGIRYIPGIEIDCVYKGANFHMLGYGIDYRSPDIARIEQNIRSQNQRASLEMLEKTRALGFQVTAGEMRKLAQNSRWPDSWTGEMFAEILLAKPEHRADPRLMPYREGGSRAENALVNFYWDFYAQGKPCHAGIKIPDMTEVLDIIHQNHGLAVLAHPGINLRGKEQLLAGIVKLGIDGIEAFSSYHSPEQARWWEEKVRDCRLFYTCGSDFHGKTKPSIQLGGHGCSAPREELWRELARLLEKAV